MEYYDIRTSRKMFSPETSSKKGKKVPTTKEVNVDPKSNNFSSLSTRPSSTAALRRGKTLNDLLFFY